MKKIIKCSSASSMIAQVANLAKDYDDDGYGYFLKTDNRTYVAWMSTELDLFVVDTKTINPELSAEDNFENPDIYWFDRDQSAIDDMIAVANHYGFNTELTKLIMELAIKGAF